MTEVLPYDLRTTDDNFIEVRPLSGIEAVQAELTACEVLQEVIRDGQKRSVTGIVPPHEVRDLKVLRARAKVLNKIS